jgi:hypothetical protein
MESKKNSLVLINQRSKNNKPDKERLDPPMYLSLPSYSVKLRFVCTNTVQADYVLDAGNLCIATGCVVDTANSRAYAPANVVKIRKIQIWAAPKSDTTDGVKTASIDWHNSTGYASGKKISDTSVSNARVLYVSSKPPSNSISSFWMELWATQFATVSLPPYAVIDISLTYRCAHSTMNYRSISNYISTPASNTLFHGRLDFNSSGNNGGWLIPVDNVYF